MGIGDRVNVWDWYVMIGDIDRVSDMLGWVGGVNSSYEGWAGAVQRVAWGVVVHWVVCVCVCVCSIADWGACM